MFVLGPEILFWFLNVEHLYVGTWTGSESKTAVLNDAMPSVLCIGSVNARGILCYKAALIAS